MVKTLRPLPAGEYGFTYLERSPELDPCDAPIPESAKKYRQYVVDVTAPVGALHEAFFDPVAVGTAVKADATNGVLEPASFTDANNASATLQSISYEPPIGSGSGTVKLQVDPHTGLGGHRLELVELDGSVSLWLEVDEATVDAPNNTLSWSVTSQPWEAGDKLMLRVEEADLGIALFDVPSTISHGQVETFTVRASGLSSSESYSIRLSSSNFAVGFGSGCGTGGGTVNVPSGRTSHSLEETLHGCSPETVTVTAELLQGDATVGSATADVEVEASGSRVRVSLSPRDDHGITKTDMTIEWTDVNSCVGRYFVVLRNSEEYLVKNLGFHPAPETTMLRSETGYRWDGIRDLELWVRVSCDPADGTGRRLVGEVPIQSGLPSAPSSE